MGNEWAFIASYNTEKGLSLGMYKGSYFQGYDKTELIESIEMDKNECYLRVNVDTNVVCNFFYSLDGEKFYKLGQPFNAVKGTWIGAKVGLFSINPNINGSKGYSDFDWFRIE